MNLDSREEIAKVDKENVLGSVEALPEQCLHALRDTEDFKVPDSYKSVNKIVTDGMGGSGLGSRMIQSIFGLELKYPLTRMHDYDLPDWADKETLVICSSFSGETEEPVEMARQAEKRGCKWMSIGTGGTIIELAKKYKRPYYQIVPTHNPSKQPRMANGYSVVGQLIMASKAGVIKFDREEVRVVVETMREVIKRSTVEVKEEKNPAKQMAKKIFNKILVFVAARHMVGSVHSVKNQANENVKNFSCIFEVPELNHHLMEGLKHPEFNKKDLMFIFVNSKLYPEGIQKRMKITQAVVGKNKVSNVWWEASSKGKLNQAFEYLQFGGYVNSYLATLYNQNSGPIPWVDYFKKQLGQPLGQWKE